MDIQQVMQQARVMQDRMQQMQAQLADMEVTGEAGGGMVTVTMTCKGDIRKLDISDTLIVPGEKETLEDLVIAAVNMARKNADDTMANETQKMMEEMGLPSNFELPKF